MPTEEAADCHGELAGLLLAAGAGRRMGSPKALLHDQQGRSLVVRTLNVMLAGGCGPVVIVIGAAAGQVRAELTASAPPRIQMQVVEATDWAEGQGTSLRAGLDALTSLPESVSATLVMLVDLPGVGPDALIRVGHRFKRQSLARATYANRPGHPVLIGRDHWPAILAGIDPAHGAREYLRGQLTKTIACDDLADGRDVDSPSDATVFGLSPTKDAATG